PIGHFCKLPGSVQFTANGVNVVAGGPASPDLTWMKLPEGFCVHFYATVGNARQIRFAPGGDLFVASPTTLTTGAGPGGLGAIVVAPDDDRNGVADTTIVFLSNLPSTQGLLFANDHFYYQDHTKIVRIPFSPGDRAPRSGTEQIIDVQIYASGLHWPK